MILPGKRMPSLCNVRATIGDFAYSPNTGQIKHAALSAAAVANLHGSKHNAKEKEVVH